MIEQMKTPGDFQGEEASFPMASCSHVLGDPLECRLKPPSLLCLASSPQRGNDLSVDLETEYSKLSSSPSSFLSLGFAVPQRAHTFCSVPSRTDVCQGSSPQRVLGWYSCAHTWLYSPTENEADGASKSSQWNL